MSDLRPTETLETTIVRWLLSRLPGHYAALSAGLDADFPIAVLVAHRSMPSHWGALSGPSLTVDTSTLKWPREVIVGVVAEALQRLLGTTTAPSPGAPLIRLVIGNPVDALPDDTRRALLVETIVELLRRVEPVNTKFDT